MNIQPNLSASSITGSVRAGAANDAESSGVKESRNVSDKNRLDSAANGNPINEGDQADQRGADGRQLPQRKQSDLGNGDELRLNDVQQDQPASEQTQSQSNLDNRLDYEA